MKLYITHVGKMALAAIPLLRLPQIWPKTISVKLVANKYTRIDCLQDGTMNINGLLGAINADNYSLDSATKLAVQSSMEIVGIAEYRDL